MSADMKTLREALRETSKVPRDIITQNHRQDAQDLLAAALDELEALRVCLRGNERAFREEAHGAVRQRDEALAALTKQGDELRELRDRLVSVTSQRDKLARVLERAKEWMGYNPPTTGWGLLDHGEDKTKREIFAEADAALAKAGVE